MTLKGKDRYLSHNLSPSMDSSVSRQDGPGQDLHLGPSNAQPSSHRGQGQKRKNHRAGRKKRHRRQSFAASIDDGVGLDQGPRGVSDQNLFGGRDHNANRRGRNLSNASFDSEALLDHRYGPCRQCLGTDLDDLFTLTIP